jgi:hypothetical protein
LTFAANQISGNSVDGGVISNFASTGIDDNASATAVTILSDGKVGIGTNSPDVKFHVSGGNARIAGTETSGSFMDINPSNTGSDGVSLGASYYGSGSYGPIKFSTGGSERMRIDASGVVKIGGQTGTLQIGNDATYYADIEWEYNNNELAFSTNSGANFTFNSGGTEHMRIDSSGDVGIGVTPYNDCKVTIGGTVPSYSSVLMFDNNTAGGAEFFMLASDNTWSAGAGNFYMGHGAPGSGNIDMSIDGSGYIVAKEKAFIATSGTQRSSFYNSGDGAGLYTQNAYSSCGTHMEIANNAAHGWSNIYLSKSWSSGQDQRVMAFSVNTSTVGTITVNASSTSYATSSDYRLKENVVGLTGASARVNQLNPSRFNFIADDTNTLVDGFLAHEVATVVPEAITGTHDGMKDEEYEVTPAVLDDDGNVTTEAVMGTRSVPDYQGIDQSKLVPLLTAALQEALTEIASLKTRVEALE